LGAAEAPDNAAHTNPATAARYRERVTAGKRVIVLKSRPNAEKEARGYRRAAHGGYFAAKSTFAAAISLANRSRAAASVSTKPAIA
jgi:hypothetical protein